MSPKTKDMILDIIEEVRNNEEEIASMGDPALVEEFKSLTAECFEMFAEMEKEGAF
ncbi:MAG: hypothetical protein JW704_13215 [Anaerolineaceae bacterium]|nr:hypothetical protein [Anaerolineaceae bacterium]